MISHSHRTIFVHIPKCGGQSIERAFVQDLNLTWETRAPLLLRPNDMPEIGPPRLAHLAAIDYVRCRWISPDLFSLYYKFALVRDPLHRAVSICNYLLGIEEKRLPKIFRMAKRHVRQSNSFGDVFRRFIQFPASGNSLKSPLSEYGSWFTQPQVRFLMDEDGKFLVDDIFLLERFQSSLDDIHRNTNLAKRIGWDNPSSKKFAISDIDAETEQVIREIYSEDYQHLPYD